MYKKLKIKKSKLELIRHKEFPELRILPLNTYLLRKFRILIFKLRRNTSSYPLGSHFRRRTILQATMTSSLIPIVFFFLFPFFMTTLLHLGHMEVIYLRLGQHWMARTR